jgi:multiple sugar transport system substrate-binding protein
VDFYVGVTPFQDLVDLRDEKVLRSWEGVMPDAVVSDLPSPVRREVSLDGRVFSWPFLLDVTILGWNAELVERAGLDPGRGPGTWDELIGYARQVVNSGAAPYGVTFDPRPWRSLLPITHSFSTNVYDSRGRFEYRSEAAANALEVLRRLREFANPDVLAPTSTTPGLTPDEQVFSAGLAAYYVKYQNAPIRMASTWPDPGRLVLTRLPRAPGGAGKTVFWTTGIGLVRFGSNRRATSRYATSITRDENFWRVAIGGGRAAGGQIPVSKSLWRKWLRDQPPWLPAWAEGVYRQLAAAEPIPPSAAGKSQFRAVVQHELNRYLDGESSAKQALRRAAARAVARP